MTFRRHVFFLPGFDPAGTSRYRRILSENLRIHAKETGFTVEISDPVECSPLSTCFTITNERDGRRVETRVEQLHFHDIIRDLHVGAAKRFWRGTLALWRFFRTGALQRMRAPRPVSMQILYWPFYVLIAIATIGGLIGAALPGAFWPWGVAPIVALLALTPRLERYLLLLHNLDVPAFFDRYAQGKEPATDQRLDAFSARLRDFLNGPESDTTTEVLLVGHSLGAQLIVLVIERALKSGLSLSGKNVAMLTLGGSPGLMAEPEGPLTQPVRDAYFDVGARTPDLFWLDVTAEYDRIAASGVDPMYWTGRPAAEIAHGPLMRNLPYRTQIRDKDKRLMRFSHLYRHMMYLLAAKTPQACDLHEALLAPGLLKDRMRGLGHSQGVKLHRKGGM